MRFVRRALPLLVVALSGCLGQIGDVGSSARPDTNDTLTPNGSVKSFVCDPKALPVPSGLRRLSNEQLVASVNDAVAMLEPAFAAAITNELAPALAQIPPDSITAASDYVSMAQLVSQAHVDAYYAVAVSFGKALASTSARRGALLGPCATDSQTNNDSACIRQGVTKAGRLLFRRPLTSDEVDFFVATYDATGIDAEGLSDVLASLLLAPQSLYFLELGDAVIDAGASVYQLSAYELASRLSYHFWGSLPDDALLNAAADGSLLTTAGYEAQVERLFADARTRRAVGRFYAQWLKLDNVPVMDANVSRTDFQAYAGADLPTADLRAHLIEDVQDMLAYYTFASGGTLEDLFTNTRSFARTGDVAALYGNVPTWDGKSAPPSHLQRERVGLLSRIAVLANNQAVTRPIMRGVFVLRRLMCQDVQLPPNMQGVTSPANGGTQTTRQMVTTLTQTAGSTCAGCHQTINPLGFVAESFDALGRTRAAEAFYSTDDGTELASLPVDTHSDVSFAGNTPVPVSDVAGMQNGLLASGVMQACFARQYVRFSFGRSEDLTADGCMLENLRTRIVEAGSLGEVLKSIAMEDAFKTVRKSDGATL